MFNEHPFHKETPELNEDQNAYLLENTKRRTPRYQPEGETVLQRGNRIRGPFCFSILFLALPCGSFFSISKDATCVNI